jgi:hypothetical protein
MGCGGHWAEGERDAVATTAATTDAVSNALISASPATTAASMPAVTPDRDYAEATSRSRR